MRIAKAWTIASKDFRIFLRKKSILYSIVGFTCLVSIGMPLLIRYAAEQPGTGSLLPRLIDAFSFWFVIEAGAIVPTAIASFSIVGEKIQKSLEPLLATPTTDEEILLGKSLAALLPSLAATYIGAALFIALVDRFVFTALHYVPLPNWNTWVLLLLLVPLACICSVGINVLISSRANDVRTAQQLGTLMILPFGALYVLLEIGLIQLDPPTLLAMSAVMLAIDLFVFTLVRAAFQREEILTKWR